VGIEGLLFVQASYGLRGYESNKHLLHEYYCLLSC
jgi:hypothetical protein